jgi:hypothetical protein
MALLGKKTEVINLQRKGYIFSQDCRAGKTQKNNIMKRKAVNEVGGHEIYITLVCAVKEIL